MLFVTDALHCRVVNSAPPHAGTILGVVLLTVQWNPHCPTTFPLSRRSTRGLVVTVGWSGVLTLAHPRLCQKSHGNGGVLDGSCGRALQNRGVCTALYASSREKIFSFEDVRVIRSGGKAKKVKMWGVTAISSQHVPAELHTCIPGQGVSH